MSWTTTIRYAGMAPEPYESSKENLADALIDLIKKAGLDEIDEGSLIIECSGE